MKYEYATTKGPSRHDPIGPKRGEGWELIFVTSEIESHVETSVWTWRRGGATPDVPRPSLGAADLLSALEPATRQLRAIDRTLSVLIACLALGIGFWLVRGFR